MCDNLKLTILYLTTSHGEDFLIFKDPNLADRCIDEYVMQNWPKYFADVPWPGDIDDAVQYYFDQRYTEYYEIDEVVIYRDLDEIDFLDTNWTTTPQEVS